MTRMDDDHDEIEHLRQEVRRLKSRVFALEQEDDLHRRYVFICQEERRWDEAAGLSLDVVAYPAPQEHTRGQRRREERPATDHIGIDVHKRESQIRILADGAS